MIDCVQGTLASITALLVIGALLFSFPNFWLSVFVLLFGRMPR